MSARGIPALIFLVAGFGFWPSAALAEPRAERIREANAVELRAVRISEANAAELLIGGPDAIGGVGDWYLANDLVEVIVDDPGRRHAKLNHGGTLVDVGLRGRKGDDQFARLFPLVNMDQRVQVGYDTIRAERAADGSWARLVVEGGQGLRAIPRGGALSRRLDPLVPDTREIEHVRVETEYAVFPGESWVRITSTLHNEGSASAPVFAFGEVWMRGGRSIRSFVGNTSDPDRSPGFHHQSFDRNNLLGSGDAIAAYTYVAMPGMPHYPPIAYAVVAPERASEGHLQYGVTGPHVTLINSFLPDSGWRALSLSRLVGALFSELEPGASWTWRRRLLVSDRRDVASLTDTIFPWLGYADGASGIAGRVEPATERVVILVERAASGAPVTQIATRTRGPEAGRFRAVLPPGDYVLVLRAAQRPERRLGLTVAEGAFTELPPQRLAEPAWLRFEPAFADAGRGRIVVTGLGDTPDPVFGPELLDFRIDGERAKSGTETRDLNFIGADSDPTRVAVPPGRYRLTATRGPEFAIAQQDVDLPGAGAEARVGPFALERVIALQGIVSADLHVHAEASDDSAMSNAERLRSFIAEGVDVMVSTDHDHLGRFDVALADLGVADRIRVIHGVEVTSSTPSFAAPWTIGHHNAWPVAYAPLAHRQGAPSSQGFGVAELYAGLRRDHGVAVVQLNHAFSKHSAPRDGAYFSHLATAGEAYDPTRPIDAEPNRLLLATASDGRTRAIDFDAMELMNGGSFDQYRRLRRAWYSLLVQGFRRTGTGNSDSHGPDEIAGYPRNYVYVDEAGAEPAALNAAILDGRLFMTNGPLLGAFRVNGGRLGDLVAAPDGTVEVELAVAAAPWVPVDEVRLLVNGEVVRTWRDLSDGDVIRLQVTETLQLRGDALLTVEAGAPLDVEPAAWVAEQGGLYAAIVAPGFVSQAISNPIYVDVDGNRRFDAPGLDPSPDRDVTERRLYVTLGVLLLLALLWWRLRVRVGLAGRRSSR